MATPYIYKGVVFPDGTERSLCLTDVGILRSKATKEDSDPAAVVAATNNSKKKKTKFRLLCSWADVLQYKISSQRKSTIPKLRLTLQLPPSEDHFGDEEQAEAQGDNVEILLLAFPEDQHEELRRIKQEISHYLGNFRASHNNSGDENRPAGGTDGFIMDDSLRFPSNEPRTTGNGELNQSFQSETNHPNDDEGGAVMANAVAVLEPPRHYQDEEGDLQMPLVQVESSSLIHMRNQAGQPSSVLEKCTTEGPADDLVDEPAMWAISYQQLMELEEIARNMLGNQRLARATMRDINRIIIQPVCQESGTSYALRLNPKGLMLDAFITHAWDEPFEAFVESVRHVFHTTMHKPNLWICACALYQGDAQAIAAQVGSREDSLEDSAFVRALSKASMYVVVRNTTVDVYSRIWCVAELLQSKKMGLIPDKAFVTGPDKFSSLDTSCLDAQAFNPRDRDKILRILLTQHNREEIDEFVKQFQTIEAPTAGRKGLLLGMTTPVVIMCLVCSLLVVVAFIVAILVVVLRGGGGQGPSPLPPVWTENPTVSPLIVVTTPQPTVQTTTIPSTSTPPMPTMSPNSTYNNQTAFPAETMAPTILQPTPSPTDFIIQSLPEYTQVALRDQTSPQAKAYDWLYNHPDLPFISAPWRRRQLFALMTVYYAFDGENWSEQSSWADYAADSECNWSNNVSQIKCGGGGELTGLSFEQMHPTNNTSGENGRNLVEYNDGQRLTLSMPLEISLLTSLETLRVVNHQTTFDASNMIPTELGISNTALKILDFRSNNQSGTIPSELGLLSSLEQINLYDNQMSGLLPSELALLPNLTVLELSINTLQGSIPSHLSSLTSSLKHFNIENNNFNSIPEELQDLVRLSAAHVNVRINFGHFGDYVVDDPGQEVIKALLCETTDFFRGRLRIYTENDSIQWQVSTGVGYQWQEITSRKIENKQNTGGDTTDIEIGSDSQFERPGFDEPTPAPTPAPPATVLVFSPIVTYGDGGPFPNGCLVAFWEHQISAQNILSVYDNLQNGGGDNLFNFLSSVRSADLTVLSNNDAVLTDENALIDVDDGDCVS